MFLYRELFLATLISTVNVVFADILVQPGSHQHSVEQNNAHVSWPEKSEYPSDPAFSYHKPIRQRVYAQLPDQYVTAAQPQQFTDVQTAHPLTFSKPGDLVLSYFVPITEEVYTRVPDQHVAAIQPQQFKHEIQSVHPHTVQSNSQDRRPIESLDFVDLSYPESPHFSPRRHVSYTKIGGHGYTRPTVIVKYPKPAHRRYRRSIDTASTESSKPAITTYADDVAAESTLIGDKLSFIDSLLPKNQLTNTNDKHVTSRQIRSDHAITKPGLFGLNPEKMHGYRQVESPDEIQQSLLQSLPVSPNTPKQSNEQLPASIKPVIVEEAQPTLSTISHEKQLQQALHQDQQNAYQESDSKLLQDNTHVDGTKSPRHVIIQPSINLTNDQFASVSYSNSIPILKHIQGQYSGHILPWVKNLEKTHDGIKYFTNNLLDYIPLKAPVFALKKLLLPNENKYSQDFGSYSSYSLDDSDGNSNSDELLSPTQQCSNIYRVCLPSNNCICYKICDTVDNVNNVNSVYVLQTDD